MDELPAYPFPIDVGLSDDAGWFAQLMGLRWVLMHYLGLMAASVLRGPDGVSLGAIIVGGYIEVAVLVYIALIAVRWFRARTRQPEAN
jgi:hypothetical protein